MKNSLFTLLMFLGVALAASAQTTYQTPYEIGGPGVFGGENTLFAEGGSDGLCTTSLSAPWMTVFGGTSYGTVKGYLGQVSRSKAPLTPGLINTGTEGVTFTLQCGGFQQILHINFDIQFELADSYFLNGGWNGQTYYWPVTKLTYYDYRIATPSCSNLNPVLWNQIDYIPKSNIVETTDPFPGPHGWNAWAACVRFVVYGQSRAWSCVGVPGSATGSSATGGYCSYNP
jgi:hypothetical protein